MGDNKEAIRKILTAIRNNDFDNMYKFLLADKSLINENTPFGTWLHVASSVGNLRIVRTLVEFGIDINQRAGTYGGSALNEAASEGHYDVTQYLLSCGAELDTTEPERNPLFGAIMCGSKEIVQLLLDNGIDASVRYTGQYMKNMDAYDFAIERGQKEIAEMLKPYRK